VAIIGTTQYDSIQAAIDAAVVGDNLIMVYPANHGTDSIEIIQREGVNITLEAVGEVELKNQIKIDGTVYMRIMLLSKTAHLLVIKITTKL
jgi:pectin methylesterase-like acyl-CoA thioesterase